MSCSRPVDFVVGVLLALTSLSPDGKGEGAVWEGTTETCRIK